MEIPKGRRLKRCDAVAVSVYSVEDRLLKALFRPKPEATAADERARPLSEEAVEQMEPVQRCLPSAPSEGTGLTPEELDLLHRVEEGSESGTESDEGLDTEVALANAKASVIQANASSYRALQIQNMAGCVGLGVSSAFAHARECKGRHAVLLLSAGHFAVCLFDPSGQVELHRTCKRYVVRGKQGGAQGSHDKKFGKASSIGSQMRREGEKKLCEDVRKVMLEFADHLKRCDAIFVSCPPDRKSMLFGTTLQADDPRVRRIPFAGIGKPNMTACITAHSLLCSALFFCSWPAGVKLDKLPVYPEQSTGTPVEANDEVPSAEAAASIVEAQDDSEGESAHESGDQAEPDAGAEANDVGLSAASLPSTRHRRPRRARQPRPAKVGGKLPPVRNDSELLQQAMLEADKARGWSPGLKLLVSGSFAVVASLGVCAVLLGAGAPTF
eukprot:TRINITY_DN21821_c0_g1_i1.p1 TRINITY_DN21821_c0_g1~~TRINITY_DN21821_c0_g1_i1.p1  ORF type:complete len:458 (-),score=80.19 TRINITY_DN21821_c0_g1_i1:31-1356(-)